MTYSSSGRLDIGSGPSKHCKHITQTKVMSDNEYSGEFLSTRGQEKYFPVSIPVNIVSIWISICRNRTHVAVKQNRISDNIPPQMKILNTVMP